MGIALIGVGSSSIRTVLLSSIELANALNDGAGNYKIFLGSAPGGGDLNKELSMMPYVTVHHIRGGEDNQAPSRSFDITYRVAAVHKNQSTCLSLAGNIETVLVGAKLQYPDRWVDYATCTQLTPYYEQSELQGVVLWRLGAYYRLRGVQSDQ